MMLTVVALREIREGNRELSLEPLRSRRISSGSTRRRPEVGLHERHADLQVHPARSGGRARTKD